MTEKKETLITTQLIPFFITFGLFIGLTLVLGVFILLLNAIPGKTNLLLSLRLEDVLIGMLVYLKTEIDFALFIGNLIARNPGVGSQVAITSGTALGNASGTLIILAIWYLFKDTPLLLALMIIVASLVLFTMAGEGVEELEGETNTFLKTGRLLITRIVTDINKLFHPLIKIILPEKTLSAEKLPFGKLLKFSLIIPFVLGLDNFAGYIPLFNIVNVFGFSVGVFFAHALLTTFMYISPKTTTKIVRSPFIIFLGSAVFVGLATFGIIEAIRILLHVLHF